MKNIKYMAAWAAVLFAFSACQDVVEVEDLKAKDDIPSNGAPEITKISLIGEYRSIIQMIPAREIEVHAICIFIFCLFINKLITNQSVQRPFFVNVPCIGSS